MVYGPDRWNSHLSLHNIYLVNFFFLRLCVGVDQVEQLVGRSADEETVSKFREICEQHHPLLLVDKLQVYHFGPNFVCEVEAILPESMSLKHSHDIGIDLQFKLESLSNCDRAFVHLDYMARDYDEHDQSSW